MKMRTDPQHPVVLAGAVSLTRALARESCSHPKHRKVKSFPSMPSDGKIFYSNIGASNSLHVSQVINLNIRVILTCLV